MSDAPLQDFAPMLNGRLGGLNHLVGLRFVRATVDEVVAEIAVGPQHTQPYGLVHGGLYCTMVETVGSAAAALTAIPRGQSTVGLDNHTTFLRAVREGTLRAVARPLSRGRRTQVWEVEIRGDDGALAASGRLRLLNLEQGAVVAGETVAVKGG